MVEKIKFNGQSLDIESAEKEKLKAIFPQCFIEGKLDIDKLLNLCGEYIENDFEKYKFEWKGKSECYKIAGKRSTATLRPVPSESVDFENTNNLYIEGDNLEVLKLLQSAYYRKVKMIYIDPPYNTGNDFVYKDDFKDPIAKYKEITAQTTKSNPETMGRFHTNWLNMMFPRLRLAANLLRDDGVIFISIDDNEVTNLRKLCDEVFGEENFVAQFVVIRSEGGGLAKQAVIGHDYLLCYAKNLSVFTPLGKPKDIRGDIVQIKNESYWIETDWLRKEFGKYGTCRYEEIEQLKGKKKKDEIDIGIQNGQYTLIEKDGFHIVGRYRKVSDDTSKFYTILKHLNKRGVYDLEALELSNYFDFPKSVDLLREIVLGATIGSKYDSDLILDFFSGSATTAHAVMQLNAEDGGNRQFIMVQLPEVTDEKSEAFKAGYKNICEIGKERLRRAGAKIKEQNGEVDTGFRVLKLDTSNLVKWDGTPTADLHDLLPRLDGMEKTIKADRLEIDIVTEVMLKLGVPLNERITEKMIGSRKVYVVGNYFICLDGREGGITPDDIQAMCDLSPAKIVASEEAFADDVALSNAYYIAKDSDITIELL